MCDIGPPGSNYCTYAPDKTCFATGWPPCCSQDGGVNCPKNRPPCRPLPLRPAYCTSFPDTKCYKSGHPLCCDLANKLQVRSVFLHSFFSWSNLLCNTNLFPMHTTSAPFNNPCATNIFPVQITAQMPLTTNAISMVHQSVVSNTAVSIVPWTNLLVTRSLEMALRQ